MPVEWDDYILSGYATIFPGGPDSYDIGDYVAQSETKLSPDYTNTQCTCDNYNYAGLDNDKFINDDFWNNVPSTQPYCYITAALYGT